MAETYSDNYSSLAGTLATSAEAGYKPGPKQVYSTEWLRGEFTLATTVAGTVVPDDHTRMLTLHTSDRLHQFVSSADVLIVAGAVDVDIGFFLSGNNHDGAEVTEDHFATAFNLDAIGPERVDVMFESTTVEPDETGDRVWEILDLASDTDTFYDIVIHWNLITTITAGGRVVLEAEVTRQG